MARYVIDNRAEPIQMELRDNPRARVLQNCKNLLMTQMGEVPYDRQRGFDPALYHLTMEQMKAALLPELDRMLRWEPNAELISGRAQLIPESGEVLIEMTVNVGD